MSLVVLASLTDPLPPAHCLKFHSFSSSPHTMDGSLKRSRDDYDDDYDSKKQHVDATTELIANVCKDIRRIGENNNLASQVDDISYISNPIVAEFEKIDTLRTAILNTLYAVVVEQPQKTTSLSVLVLLCNAKNFLVLKYVLEFFHSKAQQLLDEVRDPGSVERDHSEDAGLFNNIKAILKFLAALAPIIDNYLVVTVFRQFLTLAVDLQKASERRSGTAEQLFYNVLVAAPYLLCNDVSDEMVAHLNDLVELAGTFETADAESTVSILQPFDSRLSNFAGKLPYEPRKIVNLILPSLVALQGEDKSWSKLKGKLFLNFREFVDPIVGASLSANTISSEYVKHPLPQLSLPSIEALQAYQPKGLIDSLWHKSTRLLFQVYNTSADFETVPAITSYFGLFFKDLSFDILTNLSFNQKEASIQLSILDLFFARDLFAPPGSSIDQLSLIHADNVSGENSPPLSTWKIEDVAVESILTMIFQLPDSFHNQIYYYTVLISCCRESPESIAPVFGRAIRYFYNNLETLDYELKVRFLDWMTIQISNFEFSWKWDEWVADSVRFRTLKYHPKKNFIKNLIAKEIRLSNKTRIKDSFVTMQATEDDAKVVYLDEFHQYLNLSLFPEETKYVIAYDSGLYGNNDEVTETISKLVHLKKDSQNDPLSISPQEELIYNFSNPQLPLNDASNKVYDFVTANWQSNESFTVLYNEILEAIKATDVPADRFLINMVFQTYAYIGSRSIYSIVSILSRDVVKLRFLSGIELTDADYQDGPNEAKFPSLGLDESGLQERQKWIIDAIFRIWIHQPQVSFLILEYLIEFGILKPVHLIQKTLGLDHNLIIDNVSCMESINRVLTNVSKDENGSFQELILLLFREIVNNMNLIAGKLEMADVQNDEVKIITEFSEEEALDEKTAEKIDNLWLFYEYRGLLKSYLRKFSESYIGYLDEVKAALDAIENVPVRDDALHWIEEMN